MIKTAKRMSCFAPSATMAISAKVTRLNGEGKKIISFATGEPDFDVPDHAKEAAIKAIRDGHNKYTPVGGNDVIKSAILEYVGKTPGLDYEKSELIVSVGAKQSLYNISQVLFEEGDEVVIFAPYWVTFPDQVKLAGAKPVFVHCAPEKGFNPDMDEFRSKVGPATKAIIMNSPCNPTGAVFSGETVREIAEVAVKNDVVLISDECYDKLFYGDEKPVFPATLGEEIKKRTLLVNAFSKTFSMTGWRLGYTLGPKEIISAMTKIQGQSTSNPVTPMQYGAAEALGDLSFLGERLAEFKSRRDIMVNRLNSIEGVRCNLPQGAFYAFPDFSGWMGKKIHGEVIGDSLSLTNLLIDHALIAPVPGSAFGAENHLRFSYAMNASRIEDGLERLSEFSGALE